MDFNAILRGVLPQMAANISSLGENVSKKGLPDGVAQLLPLLGSRFNPLLQPLLLAQHLMGGWLGLDPTVLLTFFGFCWAANKVWRQVSTTVGGLIHRYLSSSIRVSSGDEIYLHLMKWLADLPKMANSRSLMAETVGKTAWEDEDESDVLKTRISADGSGVYLNFSNQESKAPPRFIPAMGLHSFWYKGTYFRLNRKQESFLEDGSPGSGAQTFKDREYLVISCYGWSPAPIKKLLQHVKEMYYAGHHARTTVRRPSPQNMRRYGGRHNWVQVANRPVRPMKTVVLDPKQKVQVLADINEYLHPATPRWYANRGIPLRRGYLFHGPAGSGKTSLSFALAGVFGLDIYVISLLEPSLSEEDLLTLFNTLPRRCVVLLEDIDAAGLSRPPPTPTRAGADGKPPADAGSGADGPPEAWRVADLARALKKESAGADADKKGISLSGLLNAIDGVASHEGRVLIMTTNRPEALDDALIRPGRVDLQVAFTNATRDQARALFERMYEPDQSRNRKAYLPPSSQQQQQQKPQPNSGLADGGAPESVTTKEGAGGINGQTATETPAEATTPPTPPGTPDGRGEFASTTAEILASEERLDMTAAELRRIATAFAEIIPDGAFSPAEIQGFLLKRKQHPRRALAEVEHWVEGMVAQKASRSKVLQVQ